MKSTVLLSLALFVGISGILLSCRSQQVQAKAPFSIGEKTYFHWVEGKEGGKGTTIQLKGRSSTTNLAISKIYFQNHEYKVVPEINGLDFVLTGTRTSSYDKEKSMSSDPGVEYGNQPPPVGKNIPFDLKEDEAVIQYSVNGAEAFLKVTQIKQLETVYRP